MALAYFPAAAGHIMITGLSTDTKPAGSGEFWTFIEQDTGKIYNGDGGIWTFVAPPATVNIKQVEIDFGTTPVAGATFIVIDADVSPTSNLTGTVAYEAPTGKELDEVEMDALNLVFGPGSGQFSLVAQGLEGYVAGTFRINYLIG